jgi:hypothetical protein
MSQQVGQTELKAKTQQLLDGPLKHIRAAAIAAALLPLASVAATPASAQTACASAGVICGTVFNDTNGDGIQQPTEAGIANQEVQILCKDCPSSDTITVFTNSSGNYFSPLLDSSLTYSVATLIPTGLAASPKVPPDGNVGSSNGGGFSVATDVPPSGLSTNLGVMPSAALNPGTGTPGYWKNHPEAWPAGATPIVFSASVSYTKAEAIAWLGKVGKDKTTTIFASYVSAYLNTFIGNDASCVCAALAAAKTWLAAHPVGSNVAASSTAWQQIEWAHQTMDGYNNGLLCAPHRQ